MSLLSITEMLKLIQNGHHSKPSLQKTIQLLSLIFSQLQLKEESQDTPLSYTKNSMKDKTITKEPSALKDLKLSFLKTHSQSLCHLMTELLPESSNNQTQPSSCSTIVLMLLPQPLKLSPLSLKNKEKEKFYSQFLTKMTDLDYSIDQLNTSEPQPPLPQTSCQFIQPKEELPNSNSKMLLLLKTSNHSLTISITINYQNT